MARTKAFNGTRHAHGCIRCQTRYEDACDDSSTDALCVECRGGRGFTLLIENARPRLCCQARSSIVTKDQRDTYRLAGSKVWWICRDCARTHPFNPKEHQ